MATESIDDHCCQNCEKSYSDPRILDCLHSFSYKCIMATLDKDTGSVKCPTCGELTKLPNDNPLPQNIRLNDELIQKDLLKKLKSTPAQPCDGCDKTAVAYCTEKQCGFMCDECFAFHKSRTKITDSHTVIVLKDAQEKTHTELMKVLNESFPAASKCIDHDNKELNFHCNRCFKPVCLECMALHHHQHDTCKVSEKIGTSKNEILAKMSELEPLETRLSEAIKKIEDMEEAINQKGKDIDKLISDAFEQLHNLLHTREQELKIEAKKIVEAKIQSLQEQITCLTKFSQAYDHYHAVSVKACNDFNDAQVLAVAKTIIKRKEHLDEKSKTMPFSIRESADMSFSINQANLESTIKSHGAIEDATACPKNSLAIIPRRKIGCSAKMKVTIVLKDKKCKRISWGGSDVKGRLSGKETQTECDVKDNANGTYTITVMSHEEGNHILILLINGEPIKNSPFTLSVVPIHDYTDIGIPLQKIKVGKPLGVSFSESGRIFITSELDRCIYAYNNRGEPTSDNVIGNPFFKNSKGKPHGLDIQKMTNGKKEIAYVADQKSHNFHCFSIEGDDMKSFCQKGGDVKELQKPTEVKISPEGKVSVSDSGNYRIQVFDFDQQTSQLSLSHVIADFETEDFVPTGLCYDLEGNLHVTGSVSKMVHVFSSTGTKQSMYDCGISNPTAIAIDAGGFSIVVGGSSISVISPCRRIVQSISDRFGSLTGVGVSPHGSVWVVDNLKGEIVKVAMNFINIDNI